MQRMKGWDKTMSNLFTKIMNRDYNQQNTFKVSERIYNGLFLPPVTNKYIKRDDWEVKMPSSIFIKIKEWAQLASPLEVSGLFSVQEWEKPSLDKPYTFHIKDIFLACELVSATMASTEITPQNRMKVWMKYKEMGKDIRCLKGWWHIHPCQGWSSTDTKTITARLKETKGDNWSLSIVLQYDGNLTVRYDEMVKGIQKTVKDIPISCWVIDIEEEAESEIEPLLKERRNKLKERKNKQKETIMQANKDNAASFPQASWNGKIWINHPYEYTNHGLSDLSEWEDFPVFDSIYYNKTTPVEPIEYDAELENEAANLHDIYSFMFETMGKESFECPVYTYAGPKMVEIDDCYLCAYLTKCWGEKEVKE